MLRCPVTCGEAGCMQTAVRGARYCEKHLKNNTRADMKAFVDRHANEHEYDKWYDWAVWKNLRTLQLAQFPICAHCQREGATEVDHIKAHGGNWDLFVDMSNLQSLCHRCHSAKTAGEKASQPSEK